MSEKCGKRDPAEPEGIKMESKDSKMESKVFKIEPKVSKIEPKVTKMEPQGSQKATKVHPKVALGAKVDFGSQKV